MAACSTPQVETAPVIDQESVDRNAKFAEFQAFVDATAPGWTVTSLRNEMTTTGDDATHREHYYLVLKKDKDEQILYVVRAEFINPDGKTSARLYRPVIKPTHNPDADSYDGY